MPRMTPDARSTREALPHPEHHRLLGFLCSLGSTDPNTRADAALRVNEILEQHGLSWSALIPAPSTEPPPDDWRGRARALIDGCPLEPAERVFLWKILGWRLPGTEGKRRLQEIAERYLGE